jgi:hypothetical protein
MEIFGPGVAVEALQKKQAKDLQDALTQKQTRQARPDAPGRVSVERNLPPERSQGVSPVPGTPVDVRADARTRANQAIFEGQVNASTERAIADQLQDQKANRQSQAFQHERDLSTTAERQAVATTQKAVDEAEAQRALRVGERQNQVLEQAVRQRTDQRLSERRVETAPFNPDAARGSVVNIEA